MIQYYEQFFGFCKYIFYVLVLLTIFSMVGLSSFRVLGLKEKREELFLVSPVVGAAVFSLPLVFLAQSGRAISSLVVWTIVLILTLPILHSWATRSGRRSFQIVVTKSRLRNIASMGFAAVVGLLTYLQLMIKPGFTPGWMTGATWTNNDLGAYIQMATNVGEAGVRDAGLVTGWNAGLQASFDHPSAHSFFSGVSRLLNSDPYEVGIVLMATVIALMLFAATFLIGELTGAKGLTTFLGSVVCVFNPPVVASVANFFYPQLFSLALVLGYAGLLLFVSRESTTVRASLGCSLVTTAVFLVSVEVAAMMIPLVSIFVLAKYPRNRWLQIFTRISTAHVCVFVLLYLAFNKLLMSQIEVLTKLSASGVAGWKANFVSPSMLIGLTPNQFSGPYSSGTRFVDVVLILAVAVVCVYKVLRNRETTIFVSGIAVLCGLIVVGWMRWGIDGYQTWKLVTALIPFLMLLLICIFKAGSEEKMPPFVVAFATFTVGATFSWTGAIWKDGEVSSYINRELAYVLNREETRRQTGLNVFLAPYFETMAASVISGAPSRMVSPNYYYSTGQPILYRCTVTTNDRLSLLSEHGPIVVQRGQYVLVGTPKCD